MLAPDLPDPTQDAQLAATGASPGRSALGLGLIPADGLCEWAAIASRPSCSRSTSGCTPAILAIRIVSSPHVARGRAAARPRAGVAMLPSAPRRERPNCLREGATVRIRFGITFLPNAPSEFVGWCQTAERCDFDIIGIADSQSLYREVYISCTLCALNTERIRFGPRVINPLTRHPAVAASAAVTLEEL